MIGWSIRSSERACKAAASSFASGKLVAVVGSYLGTFDAAFVKRVIDIAAFAIATTSAIT